MNPPFDGRGARFAPDVAAEHEANTDEPPRHDDHCQRGPDLLEVLAALEDRTNLGGGQAEEGTDAWWRSAAEAALTAIATTGREFQAFDLTEPLYGVPDPDHGNRCGTLRARAARAGLIEPVRAAPSKQPARSGSLTRVWRGVT